MDQKHQTFGGLRTSFPPRDIHKNPRSKCSRVLQAMAQFVLKIEKLSHIMGTAPIVELARACGLHPRLWLLPIWILVRRLEIFNFQLKKKMDIISLEFTHTFIESYYSTEK